MADEMTPASMPPSDNNTPATRGDLRHLESALCRDMDRLRADVRSLNSKVNMLSVGVVGGVLLGTILSILR